jgi:2-dehydro-3-deoxygluconokinase
MLGLPDLPPGETPAEAAEACDQLSRRFPNLKQVAMTCRQNTQTGEQRYTAILWHSGQVYTSPTFGLANIVDRVGAGDAFTAGLIYGLLTFPADPQRVVSFAAAAAAIKHSIAGDANLASVAEIEQLLGPQGFDIIR